MTALLSSLHKSLEELAPDRRLLIRDFCDRTQSLLHYVERHENVENDLIEFVFTEDIGTKD